MPIFFCLLIIFCVWLSYELRKSDKIGRKQADEFWQREHDSNFVRKQSTDNLVRVVYDDTLVYHDDCDNEELLSLERKIQDTFSHEIINLTGITNTELKLQYGMANLDYLSECDGYFTRLSTQLMEWANLLYNLGYKEDCKNVLDYAIACKVDVSDIYILRGTMFLENEDYDGISELIDNALLLPTIKKDSIALKLNAMLADKIDSSCSS